jgi:hypothetical protein
MKRILLAATAAIALVTSASMVSAAEGQRFVFRWKGVVTAAADTGAGGGVSGGTGDHGDDGSGTGTGNGGDIGTGGGDGSDDGSGSGDGGDGSGGDDPAGGGARARFTAAQYSPKEDMREHYALGMPFMQPTILAAPSGDYRVGDIVTTCWDTEINDADGIATMGWLVEVPPSPLVSAVTVGGVRYPRPEGSLFIDGSGTSGCADLELAEIPEADSYAWNMGIPFGVKATMGVYRWWWARNSASEWWNPKEEPDAYEVDPYEGPAWLMFDALRVE